MDTKKLRQKILDLAIRGKLVPQDPNDEPASVLLERIGAEKERLIKEGKIKRSKKTASDRNENEIPNGWVCCRFDEICSQFSTGPFGSMVHKSDYVSHNGTPIVNPMNIVDGKIVTNNLMMVSNEKAQELDRYRLTKDDILIARRGDLRKCCIVSEESIDWLCGTGSFFLHIPFVEPRYIELFYLSEYVQTILKRECVGATMDNLNQSVLGSIPFFLPPLKEQERIVNEVNHWFSVIDELESNEGDLLKAIDKAKSKILDLAIHGKLVPQDPNDEPAIELLKRINPKFEPCDEEKYEGILDTWCTTHLGNICFLTEGEAIADREYPYIDVKGIRTGSFTTKQSGKHIKQGTTLILVDGENSGEVFRTPIDGYQGSTLKILNINKNVNSKYILLFIRLNQKALRENKVGSAIPHLNKKMFRELTIPIPPYQEQLRIVSKIEELFAVLDGIKESLA